MSDFTNLLRSCEQVTVTKVAIAEGEGVTGDPVRVVTYWFAEDGHLIVREDPCA